MADDDDDGDDDDDDGDDDGGDGVHAEVGHQAILVCQVNIAL